MDKTFFYSTFITATVTCFTQKTWNKAKFVLLSAVLKLLGNERIETSLSFLESMFQTDFIKVNIKLLDLTFYAVTKIGLELAVIND